MKKIYYIVYVVIAALLTVLMTVCAKQGFGSGLYQNYWIEFSTGLLLFILFIPAVCREIARGICEILRWNSEDTNK